MRLRTHALALAGGVATALLVTVAVTELAAARIEFSLFVGIPAGLVAGVLATVGGYLGLATDAPRQRRKIVLSWAAFGVTFLLALLAGAVLADLGVILSLALGVVVGVVVALATFLRGTPTVAAPGD